MNERDDLKQRATVLGMEPALLEWYCRKDVPVSLLRKTIEIEEYAIKDGLPHRGWLFWPPYCCPRCARSITAHQFAFSRSCGSCGLTDSGRLSAYGHKWFLRGRAVLINDKHPSLISPEFIDWAEAEKYRTQPRIKPCLVPPHRLLSHRLGK